MATVVAGSRCLWRFNTHGYGYDSVFVCVRERESLKKKNMGREEKGRCSVGELEERRKWHVPRTVQED